MTLAISCAETLSLSAREPSFAMIPGRVGNVLVSRIMARIADRLSSIGFSQGTKNLLSINFLDLLHQIITLDTDKPLIEFRKHLFQSSLTFHFYRMAFYSYRLNTHLCQA